MIRVSRLDGSELTINSDLVEAIEGTPDTVISLVNGHKLVVKETVDVVVDRIVEFRRRINRCPEIRERIASFPISDSARNPSEGVDQ
ncbi:MAG TPA: flagellar FlbD family protein [Chloroflexota bacterium]|nr:flagellar FlbD family protein [Chloroflexota bacterium]HEX2987230.1 flagellar FlbD family protein [Chloroflexota bacterium]